MAPCPPAAQPFRRPAPIRTAARRAWPLVLALLLAAAVLPGCAGSVRAADPTPPPAAQPAPAPGSKAAALLRQLKEGDVDQRRGALVHLADEGDFATVPAVADALRDADVVVRRLAEQALWAIWSRSGDDAVDDLLKIGTGLLARGQPEQAIPIFSRVIELAPDFAEGYNKRATAEYHAGQFEKSLADIDETLKRNRYHFGALSGAGLCLIELERYDEALGFLARALQINPNMDNVRELKEALEKKVRKPLV